MSRVALFMHDFKLGTAVSEVLVRHDHQVEFVNSPAEVDPATGVVVLDLDYPSSGQVELIGQLRARNRSLKVIGFMQRVDRERHARFRSAGCDLILPQSSLVKNLPSVLPQLA